MLHWLDPSDEYVVFSLCYPKRRCPEVLEERIRTLMRIGVRGLYEIGDRVLMGFRVLGKGFSSIVVLADHVSYGKVVLKIRRLDSRRTTLEYEGMILDYLSPTLVTPCPYHYTRDFILMEIICHRGLIDYLKSLSLNRRLPILRKTLSYLYLFDLMGVDHGELNRPGSHVYFCDGLPRFVDWDSASIISKPHNLTMFSSYLFFRRGRRLIEELGLNTKTVIKALKSYKNNPSAGFKLIIRLLEPS